MGWKNCVLLSTVGKENATLSPKFTQPEKVLLVQPCTISMDATDHGPWLSPPVRRTSFKHSPPITQFKYVYVYYLPSGLFVITSWASFLIPPEVRD